MLVWVLTINFIVFCTFSTECYRIENTAATVVTAKPITFEPEDDNRSSFGSSEKRSLIAKPFRPSKQLFDHLIYDQLHTARKGLARTFDDSLTEQEAQNLDYKSLGQPFSNLLVLPPETITYKFEENQSYGDENKSIGDLYEKSKEIDDLVTYGPPIQNSHDDVIYSETQVHGNSKKPKSKEIHYHKHRHLHDYDRWQDNHYQHTQSHSRPKTHSQKHTWNHDNRYRSRKKLTKSSGSHYTPQRHDVNKYGSMNKRNTYQQHTHTRPLRQRPSNHTRHKVKKDQLRSSKHSPNSDHRSKYSEYSQSDYYSSRINGSYDDHKDDNQKSSEEDYSQEEQENHKRSRHKPRRFRHSKYYDEY